MILGLLVGGVLSGKSLIHAAEIRATIAQVDQLKVAARTFREKYFYLPGDIPDPYSTQLQLTQSAYGAGNGDGIFTRQGFSFAHGEANLFFVHLSQKALIPGSYRIIDANSDTNSNGYKVSDYILKAKLGGDRYFNVWSGGPDICHDAATCPGNDGINYISLSQTTRYCGYNPCGDWGTAAALPVIDAYNIDMKVDDGKPQSGAVLAIYLKLGWGGHWAGGEFSGTGLHAPVGKPTTAANNAGATNCYDNGGVAGVAQSYTVANGNTCALSFRM